jgi:hypothetical protein
MILSIFLSLKKQRKEGCVGIDDCLAFGFYQGQTNTITELIQKIQESWMVK